MRYLIFTAIFLGLFLGGCSKGQSIAPVNEWFEINLNDQYYYGEHTHYFNIGSDSYTLTHYHRYKWESHDHPHKRGYYRWRRYHSNGYFYSPTRFKKRPVIKKPVPPVEIDEERFEKPFLKK